MELTKEERELEFQFEMELDELYELTQSLIESKKLENRYVELVEILKSNNVPIRFPIEY